MERVKTQERPVQIASSFQRFPTCGVGQSQANEEREKRFTTAPAGSIEPAPLPSSRRDLL